jgi:hypothetical protein
MITIFRTPFGIRVLATFPKKTSFNAEYFLDYLLTPIEELPVMEGAVIHGQTLVIQMGLSPIHMSKAAVQKVCKCMSKSLAIYPTHKILFRETSFWIYQVKDRRSKIPVYRRLT